MKNLNLSILSSKKFSLLNIFFYYEKRNQNRTIQMYWDIANSINEEYDEFIN